MFHATETLERFVRTLERIIEGGISRGELRPVDARAAARTIPSEGSSAWHQVNQKVLVELASDLRTDILSPSVVWSTPMRSFAPTTAKK